MTFYRVDFSSDWIKGRWGFTDRVFDQLKGREVDSAGLENAWLLDFKGGPGELGDLLTDLLTIKPRDFHRFGTIFEIAVMEADQDKMPERPRARPAPHRPPWERQKKRRHRF
ncbi:MAG: hypothetical protein V3S64_13730 [bacterium]